MITIKRAFLSCWDKRGLEELARALVALDVEIISSGGTAEFLQQNGIACRTVEEITGLPSILGGRVKTLHPAIHAGILSTEQPEHLAQLQQVGALPIQLVVVNLYPFVEKALAEGLPMAEAVELIDIGGPTLLRGAAKNHQHVVPLFHPDQYDDFVRLLHDNRGRIPRSYSAQQAARAFFYTSWYDGQIARYFQQHVSQREAIPALVSLHLQKTSDLRYGENPHQWAGVYARYGQQATGLATMEQLGGKQLSYNNYLDVAAAFALACEFESPAVAIIKHTNPCGLAIQQAGESQAHCFQRALAGDPTSAFGGIVAFNRLVEEDTAVQLKGIFLECVVAPGFQENALLVLRGKKNLRLLTISRDAFLQEREEWRSLPGLALLQERDRRIEPAASWQCVTRHKPTESQLRDLDFAWRAVKHVKSNAIVLARQGMLLGVGAGQMSRVDSVELALWKARKHGHATEGAVLASDAFFPFPDGVEVAAKEGIQAVVQPGGSIRDQEVIDAANRLGIAMMFTQTRHFKH